MANPKLTVCYQFDPWGPSIGGIQTVIRAFLKYAPAALDLQVVGITADARCTPGQWHDARLDGRSVRFLPLFFLADDNVRRKIPTSVRYTAALLARRIRSDFLHFHRLEPSLAALGWPGEKTLFIHNDIRSQLGGAGVRGALLWQRLPGAYFALEEALIGQFAHLYACNREAARFYQERYSHLAERVVHYRNMVDNERFYALASGERAERRRALATELGLAAETRFVLFAGRLHGQKDPLLLVRGFARLTSPGCCLLIAGAGELAPAVAAEVARLGLGQRVRLLGALGQERLAELQRLAHVFALTSAYEGLPMVALEALACGTPVVTTRAGDTPDLLIAGSGEVCAERTPEAVAAALSAVLDAPERYPAERCTLAAQPFAARRVVADLCAPMLASWRAPSER